MWQLTTRIFVSVHTKKHWQIFRNMWTKLLLTFFGVGWQHGQKAVGRASAHTFWRCVGKNAHTTKCVDRKNLSTHAKNVGRNWFLATHQYSWAKIRFLPTYYARAELLFANATTFVYKIWFLPMHDPLAEMKICQWKSLHELSAHAWYVGK